MNTSSIQICDAKSGALITPDDSGAFVVRDQRHYIVRSSSPLTAYGQVLQINPLSDGLLGTLYFENYVGRAEIHGLRFDVQHSKLTSSAFAKLLDGVVRDVADLAFDYQSPTALPFDRRDLSGSAEVLYHALAYLRLVMLRGENTNSLLGQFLQIARHPHRRVEHETRWTPISHATNISPNGLLAIAQHSQRLVPVAKDSRLHKTGLGRQLARSEPTFPAEVRMTARTETFDTHENRLVLHVLRLASDIVAHFEARTFLNPEVHADVQTMREQIDWMSSLDFLREVGPMQMLPLQSSVLQRREGYRYFLGHFLKLSLSSALTNDRDRWHALLDLKDGALLYELWCFFEVKRTLDALLGNPEQANLVTTDTEKRNVKWAARSRYCNGNVELSYNRTYSQKSGSYSVTLRPDIVVRIKRATGWEALILDAKLKFAGERLDKLGEQDPSEWKRAATREDLYKMHTYRDAIREAVGAFVLYPGSKSVTYVATANGQAWEGIGAIPLDPDRPTDHLGATLAGFVGAAMASVRVD